MADDVTVEASDVSRPPAGAVLVVNDGEVQRVAISAMLSPLGVVVVEAASGSAAVRAVSRQTFAVILMDVQMPILDGYETARLIRERSKSSRTPIIFITAHPSGDVETTTAYESGAVDFISTPVVPAILQAKVSVFVDLFAQAAALQRSLDSITSLIGALRESQASTQAVLESVADGIVTVGEEGLIESVNPAARALFGYGGKEALGRPLALVIEPTRGEELCGLAQAPRELLSESGAQSRPVETLGRRRDGSTFAIEVQYREMKVGARRVTLAFVRDISERAAYTESLEHRALHDSLTGLANRALFGEHLLEALASAGRTGESRAVLVMDLDGFKQVNDRLGHDRGDLLLKQVSERLRAGLRENDTIARLGGDEFGILPGGATDVAASAAVAGKLRQACEPGFVIDDEIAHVSASVGIALFPEHGDTPAELLRRADTAMYVAKRNGSGHSIYDASQETQATQQLALLGDLRHCIARGELVLHYQPKIDLSTREVSGVEALLRWRHPVKGLLAPASFMAEIERTELIEPVTRWVLDTALRQQQAWREQGVDLTMAVNISAHSLRRSSCLPEVVAELIDVWGSAPERLTLELTERAVVEASAPEILDRLHQMGEIMSIDDYGTGYSSLAYLQRLPVDELKIDRSFVTSLTSASDDEVIVRSTIDLAHNLGLTVVAEGVENNVAMDLLVAYGCDSIQGYHLSRPCPAEALTQWLTESPYGAPPHLSH